MGLGKKVLIADSLSRVVAAGFVFPTPLLDSLGCFIVMLAFSLQLYFDFSGYSDMAIGLGKMFNIDLLTNILKGSNKNVNKNLCQSTKIR